MSLKLLAWTVIFLWVAVCEGKFPKDPKPCPYGDGECIKKIINFLLSEKSDGYAPLNVVNLNPLKISEIKIKQGEESPVNIDLTFRNSELFGINNFRVSQVKGFGKDPAQVHEIELSSESLMLLSDYTISGKVLILPINGNGKSNITLDNAKVKLAMNGESMEKDGNTHLNVKGVKLSIDTSRLHFDFANLFNGDKTLGDNMNLFLNENWKDIYGEVRKSIESAYASIFKSIINNVFHKYPYEKLFAEE